MTIAEIYETELVDLPKAVEAYQQAAEWFQGEESSRYLLCWLAL
jgi:alpha-soluble NSF attachment protein